jgi:hypothetical protein
MRQHLDFSPRLSNQKRLSLLIPMMSPIQVFLMLGFENETAIHLVIARNEKTGDCYVITVYLPKSDIWQVGFNKRREL